jgi:hypothetical protein
VIGRVDDVQRGKRAEFAADRTQQGEIGQGVARALKEQHRKFDLGEMIGALGAWALWRMERKAKENDATRWSERVLCGGLGGQASAHGFTSSEKRQRRRKLMSRGDGSDDGRGENRRRIGNVAMLFHVGELVAESRDVNVGERGGEAFHEGMLHAGAGPMSEHEELVRGGRNEQERGDVAGIGNWEVDKFSGGHGDGILAEGGNACGGEKQPPIRKIAVWGTQRRTFGADTEFNGEPYLVRGIACKVAG